MEHLLPTSLPYIYKRKNDPNWHNQHFNSNILEFSDTVVTKILLFGDNTLSASSNNLILSSTIDYTVSTKRFDDSILTHR